MRVRACARNCSLAMWHPFGDGAEQGQCGGIVERERGGEGARHVFFGVLFWYLWFNFCFCSFAVPCWEGLRGRRWVRGANSDVMIR